MDTGQVSKFVLRKPSRFPQGANIRSHHGQKIHAVKAHARRWTVNRL